MIHGPDSSDGTDDAAQPAAQPQPATAAAASDRPAEATPAAGAPGGASGTSATAMPGDGGSNLPTADDPPADPAADPPAGPAGDPPTVAAADPPTATVEQPTDAPDPPVHGAARRHRAGTAYERQIAQWRQLTSRRRETGRKRPWWVELPALVIIAFMLTFLIQTFIARVYYVPSGSMEPTLHGTAHGGDRILALKIGYDFHQPRPGDVVVFKGPETWVPEAAFAPPTTVFGRIGQALGSVVGIAPPDEKDFVKRVIAVGGQTISCCDALGRVQVDGESLHEPYVNIDPDVPAWQWTDGVSNCDVDPADPTRYQSFRCFGPYTVPRGDVWVMGDHRSDSADSTYQCRGLVPSPNVHCQGPIPVKDIIGKAVLIVMPPSRWGTIAAPTLVPPKQS